MQITISRKKIFKVVKWALLVLVVCSMAMVAINARDEAPDPGIAAFTADAAPAIPDDQNAFFSLLAFDAPPEMDAHAAGMAMAAQHEDIFKHDPYTLTYPDPSWEIRSFPNTTTMITDKQLNSLVCGREGPCSNWRTANTADLQAQIDKYSGQLARYELLYAYPTFRETETPADGRARADRLGFSLHATHQIELARVALSLRGGQMAQALVLLARDAGFWRMVVRDTELQETRNDAVTLATEDVRLLADVLSTETLDAQSLQSAQAILSPLSPQAFDCHPILRHEFIVRRNAINILLNGDLRPTRRFETWYLLKFLKDPKGTWAEKLDDAYYQAFFKPNATFNRFYREYAEAQNITELPAPAFLQRIPTDLDHKQFWGRVNPIGLDFVYDPLGKQLPKIDQYYPACKARPLELEGYIRLVTLQLKAKRQGVTEQTMTALLHDVGPALADPYTGLPMQYDAKLRQLYFMGLDINSLRPNVRHSVQM